MKKYKSNATNCIAEFFKKHKVKFQVIELNEREEVHASFPVTNGPTVIMRFISQDDYNDVLACMFELASSISGE